MKDKIKNLKLKLKKAWEGFNFVSESIQLALSSKSKISDTAKHYLFQYQVLLESNRYLLEKYEREVQDFKRDENISDEEYEYVLKF